MWSKTVYWHQDDKDIVVVIVMSILVWEEVSQDILRYKKVTLLQNIYMIAHQRDLLLKNIILRYLHLYCERESTNSHVILASMINVGFFCIIF